MAVVSLIVCAFSLVGLFLTARVPPAYLFLQLALHEELSRKPVKFSRDLLEWRSRQNTLAK